MIQSDAYRRYEKDCLKIIPGKYRVNIDRPCIVTTVFFMPDNRRVDPSNLVSAAHDVMVKAGILSDDSRKIIHKMVAWCETDRKNPRTEIEIEVIE
jgi:Holliday junction resolvase RusA-like endonuclease